MNHEVATFINLQSAYCEQCKARLNADHYRSHNIHVPALEDLINEIQNTILKEEQKESAKLSREHAINLSAKLVDKYLNQMKTLVRKVNT